jgi:hypothetical protein
LYLAFQPTIDYGCIPRINDLVRCHYSANEVCRSRQINRVAVMVDWETTEAKNFNGTIPSGAACFVIAMMTLISVILIVRMTA